MATVVVTLAAEPNPDFSASTHNGSVSRKPIFVEVDDIAAAQAAVREFIEENDLGGGNWVCDAGNVREAVTGRHLGRISYNGRFWGAETEYGKERATSVATLPQPGAHFSALALIHVAQILLAHVLNSDDREQIVTKVLLLVPEEEQGAFREMAGLPPRAQRLRKAS